MTKVGNLTNENLTDLSNLLPDDFETGSPRTSQILVEDVLSVFGMNEVPPLSHSA